LKFQIKIPYFICFLKLFQKYLNKNHVFHLLFWILIFSTISLIYFVEKYFRKKFSNLLLWLPNLMIQSQASREPY